MKRTFLLSIALSGIWLLWSGKTMPFMLFLGLLSVCLVSFLAVRMEIIDEEGTPINLGFRPLSYSIWLVKEIVQANIEVTRLIIDPKLPIKPRMIRIHAKQQSELGRVILANSITLTPGTVSVSLQGDRINVHALSFEGAEDDLSGEMGRRVSELEP